MFLIRISSASCLVVVCADGIEYFVTAKCNVVSEMLNPNKISQSGSRTTRALWVKATNPNCYTTGMLLIRISSASCLIVVCADCIEYFVTAKCYVVSETLKSEQNFPVR